MSEKLKNKIEKDHVLYKCMQADFFNVFICYGDLDNKFVFQQICRIPAPQFELFNTLFFTFVEFFCPIKLPTLAREKGILMKGIHTVKLKNIYILKRFLIFKI